MRGIEKSKLLLVDDRPENLLALESVLEDLDCQVFKATSGNDGRVNAEWKGFTCWRHQGKTHRGKEGNAQGDNITGEE